MLKDIIEILKKRLMKCKRLLLKFLNEMLKDIIEILKKRLMKFFKRHYWNSLKKILLFEFIKNDLRIRLFISYIFFGIY